LFEVLNEIFRFSVDAAASVENAVLPRYWDEVDDALRQDWAAESAWCNPPFSRPAPFLAKATTAHLAAVLLRADCLTTRYAGAYPPTFLAVPRGRISFDRPEGGVGKGGAAPFGCVLYLYGAVSESQLNELERRGFQVFVARSLGPC
jgi:phage N-6-adenine-methyltransferase